MLTLLGSSLAQQTPAAAPPASSTQAQPSPAAQSQGKTQAKSQGKTPSKSQSAPTLTTQKDKFSYALGMNLGANFKKQSVPGRPRSSGARLKR